MKQHLLLFKTLLITAVLLLFILVLERKTLEIALTIMNHLHH